MIAGKPVNSEGMPSRRPTALGPVPAPRGDDDEAPTRSGFGETGDEERTAVDDRVARSVAASVSTVVDGDQATVANASASRGQGWEEKTVAESGGDATADFDSIDVTGEKTADRGVQPLAQAPPQTDDAQTLDRPGPLRKRKPRNQRGTSVETVDESLARPRTQPPPRPPEALSANPSTIVEDEGDHETLDEGARPLPPLAVVPGGAQQRPEPPKQARPTATLTVIGGNDRGRSFPLDKTVVTVGRAVDNDVVLTDIAASRHHLTVVYDGNGFLVRDLGSGNGTLINNQAKDEAQLSSGDQLELGNTLFRFEISAAVAGKRRQVLELGDDQSTVAERPRGLRPLPLTSPPGGVDAVPAVASPAVTVSGSAVRPNAPAPLRGAGAVNAVASYPVATAPREAQPTAAVLPVPANLGATRTEERRNRRRVYAFAVAIGIVLAIVMAAAGGGDDLEPRAASDSETNPAAATPAEGPGRAPAAAAIESPAPAAAVSPSAKDESPAPRDDDGDDGDSDEEILDLTQDTELARAGSEDDKASEDDDRDKNEKGDEDDAKRVRATPDRGDARNVEKLATTRPTTRPKAPTKRRVQPAPPRRAPARRTVKAPRDRAARPAVAPRRNPPRRAGKAGADVVAKAAELYRSRQFGGAAQALRGGADKADETEAKKLRSKATAYESVGKYLAAGDAAKRTNAPGAMVSYRKALSLDRKAGSGIHGTYIRLRLRDVAPRAAAAFMAQKRYEAAKRAADEAVNYGAGADPMIKRVRSALSRKAESFYKAGMAERSTNAKLARANFKRVLGMVSKDDPLYGKARAALGK